MATIRDVARRARVNIGTVSRVLNRSKGHERISGECARRIHQAAEELGYRGSYFARSMLRGKAGAIGIVLPAAPGAAPLNWFTSGILAGVFSATAMNNYHCVSIAPRGTRTSIDSALEFLGDGRIDGLVVPGIVCRDEEALGQVRQSGYPVVLMQSESATDLPRVNLDVASGMAKAVDHVADLGHAELMWMDLDKPSDPTVRVRREAVVAHAFKRDLRVTCHSIAPVDGQEPDVEIERYRAQCEESFREHGVAATAIICYDDLVAIAVCAAARNIGISVPLELSVVGFDDIFAQMTYPPLTTVSHMLSQLAHRCVELLIESDQTESFVRLYGYQQHLEADLVVRRSTAVVRKP